MPENTDESKWSRWRGSKFSAEDPRRTPCVSESGLSYETFIFRKSGQGKIEEAVIAYRGTENYDLYEKVHDWRSNFSVAFGFTKSQYSEALARLPHLVAALKMENPEIRIYATGHSLGGGLAQQAAYASSNIERAYAFDPSSVTNWSYLKLNGYLTKEKGGNPDPTIYRIYHRGEILAYMRAITSRLNLRRFGRSDYEFHFQKEKAVGGHSMAILACHFMARITITKAIEDSHFFTAQSISKLKEDQKYSHLCPSGEVEIKNLPKKGG